MPMVWNNESSTKLLFGILTQIRESSIKLDYSKLAQHMGPECTVSAIRGYISRQSGKVNDGGPSADKRPKTPRAPRTPKKRKLKETSSEEEPELESGHENENLQNIDALDALIKTEKDFEESASSLKDDDMIFAPVKLEDMDRMFENDI